MLKDDFLLDPQITFLNHGSFGACPRPVFEKYQEWQRRLEREPVQFLGVELDQLLLESRQELGAYLHASAQDLIYVPNATHGVNIVSRSLKLLPGDEVLTTDQEYGACTFAWEFACQKTGAKYVQQPILLPAESDEQIEDQVWQGVTPHTKVIYLSHICSQTSLTIPVQSICQRARKAGILTIIDGAHAPGQLALNLEAIGADFYTGNCHKWMLSPKGAAFLYAASEVQPLLEPLIVSWGYQSRITPPHESTFIDLFQWTGTKDPSAALTVPAAIAFMKGHEWDSVRTTCHAMVRDAMVHISQLTGIPPLYPYDSNLFQQMGTIPIPKVNDFTRLKDRLYSEYKIEIPVIDWNDRHFVRLSVQGFNTEEDILKLETALSVLLPGMIG